MESKNCFFRPSVRYEILLRDRSSTYTLYDTKRALLVSKKAGGFEIIPKPKEPRKSPRAEEDVVRRRRVVPPVSLSLRPRPPVSVPRLLPHPPLPLAGGVNESGPPPPDVVTKNQKS